MSLLKPFRGLRPPRELVKKVAAPPYDVVNRAEAAAYAQGNPMSFFHVSRPEIDLPPEVDEHDDAAYARGAQNLRHFVQQGWLWPDPLPTFYLYRQKMGAHVQTGLVAAASVEGYDRGLIKKHELTRADKEDDRTRHIDALDGNDEPVFLTYKARPEIDALVAEVGTLPPEYELTTEDGIEHRFWVVPPSLGERLGRAFEEVSELYIADGHHRSAAASRTAALRRGSGLGQGGWDHFLAVVFPHDQMQILPYHRLVKDLNGHTPEQFLAKVADKFDVTSAPLREPAELHSFGVYLNGTWRALRARPGSFPQTPVGSLDVAILQHNLLTPILGIGDPRTDKRIAFVGGIRGPGELEKEVGSGRFALAISMYPTRLAQLMAIADAGDIMPPKSTWFEPKLRSGLVVHPFRPDR